MLDAVQQRLETLKGKFTKGQERPAQLENESTLLRHTLLRISGAIQVLKEMLAQQASPSETPAAGEPA